MIFKKFGKIFIVGNFISGIKKFLGKLKIRGKNGEEKILGTKIFRKNLLGIDFFRKDGLGIEFFFKRKMD